MTIDELLKELEDSIEAWFNLRFQKKTGALENVHAIRKVKKNITRIKTVINEKTKKSEA
jgi:large subunit ribosomal protein L29